MPTTPVCGNGKLEKGEACECPTGTTGTCAVTDPTQTCASLETGTSGVLLCDAANCMLDPNTCVPGSMAGSGGSGTGG
ncbi:MAG TPA: hypothetical protein VF331_00665 [Polyangiales bacterium]